MSTGKHNAIIGTVVLLIVVGVPLALMLGPIALIVMAAVMTSGLIRKKAKHIPPKRTRQQEETDELITTILPVINSKN